MIERILESGDATSRELCAALGVSQPTLSRRLAEASRVVSYGTKSATRYTVMVPRRNISTATVYQVDASGRVSTFGVLIPVRGDRFVFQPTGGTRQLYDGLPWFVQDLRPQGFMGRHFPGTHPDLQLPLSINEWDDGHALLAISARGEDLSGNLIVGAESLDRHLRPGPREVTHSAGYPSCASRALERDMNTSSAGGEQPKFTCFNGSKDLIVKFSPPIDGSPAARRWADLLACEHIANVTLGAHGIDVAQTRLIEADRRLFLESERFDRTAGGRLGMVSLTSVDAEFAGYGSGWTRSTAELARVKKLDARSAGVVVILEHFGRMIANTDMHHGNISFITNDYKTFCLAPVYDMVPMLFAPSSQGEVSAREFQPPTPKPEQLPAWIAANAMAIEFWGLVQQHHQVSADFKAIAATCRRSLTELQAVAGRIQPALTPP